MDDPQPPHWQIYAEQIARAAPGHGHAVWEPQPLPEYDRVHVGDVGYFQRGCFIRLGSAIDDPPSGITPLSSDSSLDLTRILRREHSKMSLHVGLKKKFGVGVGLSAEVGVAAGISLAFESELEAGATLLTKDRIISEDTRFPKEFRQYFEDSDTYSRWLSVASREGWDNETCSDICLITGCDITGEWALTAFQTQSRITRAQMEFRPGSIASGSLSVWGQWQVDGPVHFNCGPPCSPGAVVEDTQCIFVRRVVRRDRQNWLSRLRRKKGKQIAPKVLKAGAGPHDLGGGKRFDEDGPAVLANDGDPEEDSVVDASGNPQWVDVLDPLFDYVFENSNVDVVVLHDHHLSELGVSGPNSIASILSRDVLIKSSSQDEYPQNPHGSDTPSDNTQVATFAANDEANEAHSPSRAADTANIDEPSVLEEGNSRHHPVGDGRSTLTTARRRLRKSPKVLRRGSSNCRSATQPRQYKPQGGICQPISIIKIIPSRRPALLAALSAPTQECNNDVSPSMRFGTSGYSYVNFRPTSLPSSGGESVDQSGRTTVGSQVSDNNRTTYASLVVLIIGIDVYEDPDVDNLSSAVSDAKAIQTYFAEDLLVPERNLYMLLDAQATHANITAYMEQLIHDESIHKGDPIVVYFAGQGANRDLAKDTSEGYVSDLICPCDRGVVGEDGIVGALDLGSLVRHLSEVKGDNITVIMDCSGRFSSPTTHMLLTACREDEQAWESDEGASGLFTSALLDTLRSCDLPRLSYAALIADIGSLHVQTPQCMGKNRDRVVFNGMGLGTDKKLLGVRRYGMHELRVDAGVIHGVVPGTEFAVQSHNFFSTDNYYLGHFVASEVHAVWCVAHPKDQGVIVQPNPNKWASVSYWGNVEDPYILAFSAPDNGSTRQAAVLARLEQMAQGSRAGGDMYMVRRDDDRKANLSVYVDEKEMVLERRHPFITEYCNPYFTWTHGGQHQEWDVIQAIARFDFHLDRKNPEHPLQNVSMDIVVLDEKMQPKPPAAIRDGVAELLYEPDAEYAVVLYNHSDVDLWCSLYYMDPGEYSVREIYAPPSSTMRPPLRRHSELTLGYGSTGVPPFTFVLQEHEQRDCGFLKLFISEQYADLSLVEQNQAFEMKEPENTPWAGGPIGDDQISKQYPDLTSKEQNQAFEMKEPENTPWAGGPNGGGHSSEPYTSSGKQKAFTGDGHWDTQLMVVRVNREEPRILEKA